MPYVLTPSFIIWTTLYPVIGYFAFYHYDTFQMGNIFNCSMKSYHGNYKIQTKIDTDSYYTYYRDSSMEPIIPHGAVPYFIAVSGINFISKSNQVHRLKQIQFLINFIHGKVKRLILWKFLKKRIFTKEETNGKEDLVVKKWHPNIKI
eukprot:84680_1